MDDFPIVARAWAVQGMRQESDTSPAGAYIKVQISSKPFLEITGTTASSAG
jgi:hypothetical protein